ncbi:GtrA family protein [Microbulbifer halophilus]|uniref:GtrA family protein n=1 Tax=Microbulbifer halophilus TaxID=453963 RepID=A0ABW5EEC1_9GAMM|nr:GtrA family protein [Microbulbifer halophilus]MCW8127726.1 GtrA family protein [Microbulbifer halophilus]
MIEWLLQQRFVRFATVGAAATLMQFSSLALFVELLSTNAIFASAAAFSLSAGFNYWLNYHFTFGSRAGHRDTLPKFVLVALIGLTINTTCFTLFVKLFHYFPAQCIATGVTLLSNFVLHQRWIYRREE